MKSKENTQESKSINKRWTDSTLSNPLESPKPTSFSTNSEKTVRSGTTITQTHHKKTPNNLSKDS